MRCLRSSSETVKKGDKFLFPLLFVLFRAPVNWMIPTHVGEGNYFTEFIDSNVSPIQKHPHTQKFLIISEAHSEIMFNPGTPWPVKLTHKINHHRGLSGFPPAGGRVRSGSSSCAARHVSIDNLFGSLLP